MADEINKEGAPLANFSQVAWATSLGGSEKEDRQVIHKRGCFGGEDGSNKANVYKYVSRCGSDIYFEVSYKIRHSDKFE